MPWKAIRRIDSAFHRKSWKARYSLALLFVAFALALDFAQFAKALPSLVFMAAVALSARFCGFGPALVATLASLLAVDYLFLARPFGWPLNSGNLFQLLFFTAVSLIIVSVARQRSQAERLAEKEAFALKQLLETISEGFVVFDADWNFVYVNAQAARLAGTTVERLLNNNLWELYPELKGTVLEENYRRAMADQVTTRFDLYYPPLKRWFHINAYPGPARLTVLFQDMTERKAAEESLRRSEKLATAGRLAATIAHEINNPLEAITNLLYIVRGNPLLDEKARQHLEMADHELSHLSQLAKQSLGFYRDTSTPVQVDLKQLMDDVLTLYRRRLEAMNIDVEKRYADDDVVVAARPGELRQVLFNLMVNAIDAMRENGRLSVRLRPTLAGTNPGRPGVRITVADNGCGVGKEHMSRLFEPFYTTKKDIGTGLGLWISREIISKYGGSIRVRSSTAGARHGTVFVVYIPTHHARSASLQPAARTEGDAVPHGISRG